MHNNLPIKLSALALAVGFCFATPAFADNSTGTVYGQAKAGTTVTVVSADTGLTRQVMVDANGRYRFAALPTGKYKVTSDGQSRDITVSIGTGSAVSFDDGATEVISVTGSRIS
ncbi:MAG: carboxypeptidase-like regulatory domain-containing protein, partial [Gammaproteobacteria bacterium]|nr:carboxypeptidase-like regulatory domain-containing protein [Gammaproteobacteria bacterium]